MNDSPIVTYIYICLISYRASLEGLYRNGKSAIDVNVHQKIDKSGRKVLITMAAQHVGMNVACWLECPKMVL